LFPGNCLALTPPVYYATHTFFLSPQAIYILVFNLCEDEQTNKIEYWLNSIQARAGRPPIVLVGEHSLYSVFRQYFCFRDLLCSPSWR
jgi:hypothetical protein